MKKMKITLKEMKMMAAMMNEKVEEISAIQKLKDDSRMTSTLYVIKSEGMPMINVSNCITICFESIKEMNEYITKKFEIYNSDKEMWQSFTGMDDETWEEWNK